MACSMLEQAFVSTVFYLSIWHRTFKVWLPWIDRSVALEKWCGMSWQLIIYNCPKGLNPKHTGMRVVGVQWPTIFVMKNYCPRREVIIEEYLVLSDLALRKGSDAASWRSTLESVAKSFPRLFDEKKKLLQCTLAITIYRFLPRVS